MCLIGNTELLWKHCRGIEPHLLARGKSHGVSRLCWEPGLYSRITAGMILQSLYFFSDVRTAVYSVRTPQESPQGLTSNTDTF